MQKGCERVRVCVCACVREVCASACVRVVCACACACEVCCLGRHVGCSAHASGVFLTHVCSGRTRRDEEDEEDK
jgi:hypothetical protein